jgi:catechol 2,3-dioxygenase-like lactoylglutathione lyase family enzyme
MKSHFVAAAALGVVLFSGTAFAQLVKAKDNRIVFGHLHVHGTSSEVHRKFWLDVLGGTVGKVGAMDVALYRDGLIEWESPTWAGKPPAGGTMGTVVDHVAFSVTNLRATLDRAKAAGFPIVSEKGPSAFVMGPDDFKVELIEQKDQNVPIAMHHIHWAVPQPRDVEAWYVKMLAAKPGKRGATVESAIPGAGLTFAPSQTPVIGTKGRVLDHIGFEVQNLEAFTKELEAMGVKIERIVKTKMANVGDITIAYITDPFGTYIEFSEGLDRVQAVQ